MRSVLMISRYAPPMFDVGGKRVGRFARELPALGWSPQVLTSPVPRTRPVDPSALPFPDSVRIERRLVPSWWPEKRSRPSDPTSWRPVPAPRPPSLLKRLERQLAMPVGPEALLAARTRQLAHKLAERREIDLVFASSSPYAMLIHGVAAARALDRPLVLDLRDPWSLNFLQEHRSGWVRRSEAWIEERLFGAASRVIFTCASATRAYAERYPALADRFRTITNAFDGAIRTPVEAKPDSQLRLVHFGNCYGPRSLETPLRAIRLLCNRGARVSDFDLLNLGRIGERDLELARSLGLDSVLRFEPARAYEDGLEVLRRADLQVLVGYGRESLFIPAKLFDYMAAGSPILGVVPRGEVSQIIESRGLGRSCEPGEVERCAELLDEARKVRRAMRRASTEDVRAFTARATTQQLADLFDEVTAGPRRLSSRETGRPDARPTPASSSHARAS